ncbi:MAG: FecR family protein [Bacteroidales bacterium]
MIDKDILFEDLMSRYISDSISDEDKTTLFSLVEESELYRKEYNKMVKLYALLQVSDFEAQKDLRYASLKKRLWTSAKNKDKRRWLIYTRKAVAVVLLFITVSLGSIAIYEELNNSGDSLYSETVVPLGSQTEITLPDGSTVVLNSGSILKYPLSYGRKERSVYLEGEGYFEVSENKEKTFKVHTKDMKIEVTGTVFNIRSYPEAQSAEISLINGGVDVSTDNKYIRLSPNEKAIYNRETGLLHSESTESYKSAMWTTGRLSFVNTSFTEILKDIERKYNVKIRIESDKVAKEYFSGCIDLKMSLREVFNFIDVDKKYQFEISGSTILLKDR